jgi:hypothetical protein
MATITPTLADLSGDGTVRKATWSAMTFSGTDVGAAFPYSAWVDQSVQVTGTFGAGGNVRWEGSNDGTNYVALTDPQGNALDFTTAKIEAVTEIAALVRPRVTAGDGTTSLTVTLVARNGRTARGG